MDKLNVAWTIAALVCGAGGVYAVWPADDSIAQARTAVAAAAQGAGISGATPAIAARMPAKAAGAVNINPFGK